MHRVGHSLELCVAIVLDLWCRVHKYHSTKRERKMKGRGSQASAGAGAVSIATQDAERSLEVGGKRTPLSEESGISVLEERDRRHRG